MFNGSRFRSEIAPRISDFVLSMGDGARLGRNGGSPARKAANGKTQNGVPADLGNRPASTKGFAAAKRDPQPH